MRGQDRRAHWGSTLGRLAGALLLLGLVVSVDVRAEGEAPVWTSHTSGLEVTGLSSLVIHPRRPDVLWAHVHGLGIACSENGGKDWEVRHEGIDARHVPDARSHVSLTIDPNEADVLWLVTRGHVYCSEDAGKTWQYRSTQALASYSWDKTRNDYLVAGVVVDPKKSMHVLAGTRTGGAWRGGLYETTDGGKTWEQIAGDEVEKSNLGHDAWPIVLDPRTDKNVLVGGAAGVWYSDDRGRTFKRADPGDLGWHDVQAITEMPARSRDVFLCDGRGLWGSRDGGKRWDKDPHLAGDCVTAYNDPHSRRRLYAVLRDTGLHVSDDARHDKWSQLGHEDIEIAEVLVHPRDSEVLFFVSHVTGLHVSRDQGETTEAVGSNVEPVVPPMVCVAAHPVDTSRALALDKHGTVFLSEDRGVTWRRAGRTGMIPVGLFGDPAADGTWWAYGRGLVRTVDNGATWDPMYVSEDPEDRVVEARFGPGGRLWVLEERTRVLSHSEDGGKTWKKATAPKDSAPAWASSFDVDATDPEHVVLATRSLARLWTPKDQEGGPWESWDGGKTWEAVRDGLFDGKNPKRNWNRGTHVVLDSTQGVMLYAAEGLGVFARHVLSAEARKKREAAPWVDVGPDLPNLGVTALVLHREGADEPVLVTLQAEGANATRTFERTTTARIAARLGDGGEEGGIWMDLPDPPARLAWLVADPKVPGRLLACDRDGKAGVLAYGVPGAKPASEPPPEQPAPSDVPLIGPKPPEGLLAFSGGADGAVRVWDLGQGRLLSALPGHTAEVFALALAPDESVVASGGADRAVRLFNAADGKLLAEGIAKDEYDAVVNGLAFAPDSKTVFAAMEQNWGVVAWNIETGEKRLFEGHTGGVLCVAVTPDGNRIVSGSRDQSVRTWDVATGQVVTTINVGTEVLCLALSPDGKRAYVGGRGTSVRGYDLEAGTEIGVAEVQRAYVSGLAVSPDGRRVYAAGDAGVVVLDGETLQLQAGPLEGPGKAVFCVDVSADGQWIVGGDSDNGLWLWHADDTKPRWSAASAHAGAVHAVALTPDVVAPGGG